LGDDARARELLENSALAWFGVEYRSGNSQQDLRISDQRAPQSRPALLTAES